MRATKKPSCAWCGADNQPMTRLNQSAPLNACVDWAACGTRELERYKAHASTTDHTFGRKVRQLYVAAP